MWKSKSAENPAAGRVKSDFGGKKYETLWLPELNAAFRPDVETLKRELHVLENARDDGRANRPGPEERNLNEGQTRIVNRVFKGVALMNQFLAEQLGASVTAARRAMPRPLEADAARAEIETRINETLHGRRGELARLRERELETLRDLNYFRRRHDLNRSAAYRESPYLFAAVLIGMLVLESVLNAFLLRRISEQGWVGGVVIATLISAVNVGLGVLAGGVGWRLAGHRMPMVKAAGYIVSAVAFLLAFYWNIYVAHFREVAETAAAAGQAGGATIAASAINALDHIRERGLFGFGTLFSWGLFAVGLGVHLFASKEAWDDMADRYWDYKRYDQAFVHARDHYHHAVEDLREDAAANARTVVEALERTHAGQEEQKNQIVGLNDMAVQRWAEVRDAEGEWARKGAVLLQAYRDENLAVRTAPPPAHFATMPTADDFRQGRGFGEAEDAAAARRDIERALGEIRELSERAEQVQAANASSMAQVKTRLAEAVARLEERLEGVRQSAEREAESNLARRPAADPGSADGASA
jgi:hypothetical protein